MRKNTCPHCDGDLHACVQCRFHDPSRHNQCREPQSAMVRDRKKPNLCDYFEFGGKDAASSISESEKARKKLEELFK